MSESPVTISVIIPTFNRALELRKSIESVLSQTYRDFELLIVDDGSEDDTAAVVNSYIQNTPGGRERIRYFYQSNQGKSVALNNGLVHTRGAWIAFLDSDDCWLPKKLEMQTQALLEFGPSCRVAFTDARYVNNPNLRMSAFERADMRFNGVTGVVRNTSHYLLVEPHMIYMQSLLVRSDVLKVAGGFDPELRVFQDKDFVFRLSHQTDFCYINLPLLDIDRTSDREVGLIELAEDEDVRLKEQQYICEKWLTLDWLEPAHCAAIHAQLGRIHSEWATWYLFNEKYAEALQSISKATLTRSSSRLWIKRVIISISPRVARRMVIKRAFRRAQQSFSPAPVSTGSAGFDSAGVRRKSLEIL